jgi:predicted Holliday junction resolvase-like endonuclease
MTVPEIVLLLLLFLVMVVFAYFLGKKIGELKALSKIPKEREEAVKQSRAVLSGQFSEQIAPYLPDFPFSPTEARFIGKPVDFIVFNGMDEKKIEEVVFVEVKSGKSKLSVQEKGLKDAIEQKKVKWFEYRVPEGLIRK